jgi:pyridoxine 5-phosphate synthase
LRPMRLYVNIDHVATLRQARRTDEPDPVRAAMLVELAGADGITVHLREDRRHIQDRDVRVLAETVRTVLNLELAAAGEILELACELAPYQATLVPEKREEITTEGGLDLEGKAGRRVLKAAIGVLRAAGTRTALFIDPSEEAVRVAADLGADAVELHTGEYANAPRGPGGSEVQLGRLAAAAELARELELDVHAGHGLTYENVTPVAGLEDLEELNIGHSIMSRAVLIGMQPAVREMIDLIRRARQS